MGLHPRDIDRLIAMLRRLRDHGNSVLVVEHDPAVIRAADWIVDIGPRAGDAGGELVFGGRLDDLLRAHTATSRALNDQVASPSRGRRTFDDAVPPTANPPVAPRPRDVETPPGDLRETELVFAAVEALKGAVARSDPGCRKAAAASAWHAQLVVRFFCSTFGDGIASVGVNDDGFVVITAELSGVELVDASIVVGPEGTCACKISAGVQHLASTAPHPHSFKQILKKRLAEVAVRRPDGDC